MIANAHFTHEAKIYAPGDALDFEPTQDMIDRGLVVEEKKAKEEPKQEKKANKK